MVLGADAENPAFRQVRSQLKWPLNKTHPVSDAGRVIVNGIERRSAVVTTPRWMHAAIALRGLLGPLTKREMLNSAPEAIALYEAEYARDEAAASRAVGAGGAADARATGARSV